ncbi:hypothetical protein GCM10028800_21080 [Nesterenkonia populi]
MLLVVLDQDPHEWAEADTGDGQSQQQSAACPDEGQPCQEQRRIRCQNDSDLMLWLLEQEPHRKEQKGAPENRLPRNAALMVSGSSGHEREADAAEQDEEK